MSLFLLRTVEPTETYLLENIFKINKIHVNELPLLLLFIEFKPLQHFDVFLILLLLPVYNRF